jgi:N-acetylglutamate synthase-like GNAT family acetyltransferase
MVPVDVPNLSSPETIFGTTKAVRPCGDAGPTHCRFMNLFTRFHVVIGYRLRVARGSYWISLPVYRVPCSVFLYMIREAEAKDVSALSRLYRQLVGPVAPDTPIDVREDRIEEIRANPHNFLFVLEINDRICGTAFLTLCLDPLYRFQPYAVLENFVIDEREQGKSYGKLLMRYVEHFCGEADCSKIMLLSSSKRSEAHRFFEKQGFSAERKKGFVKYRSQLRGE